MFPVSALDAMHAYISKSEWIVNCSCTHHVVEDTSLFFSLSKALENVIFVVDDC